MYAAASSSEDTISIFDAKTGQFLRSISLHGKIVSSPIINGDMLHVVVEDSSGSKHIMYFSAPYFNMIRSTSI
jgi:hypothetical protein